MTPEEALATLSDIARDRFDQYALDLVAAGDPEAHRKLYAYAETLADWLSDSMRPIIEAARPRVLH